MGRVLVGLENGRGLHQEGSERREEEVMKGVKVENRWKEAVRGNWPEVTMMVGTCSVLCDIY